MLQECRISDADKISGKIIEGKIRLENLSMILPSMILLGAADLRGRDKEDPHLVKAVPRGTLGLLVVKLHSPLLFSCLCLELMSEQSLAVIPDAGPSISDYELLRVIGRGAYGEVWLARNLTGSFVALKIVRRASFDHDRPFGREFEGIKRFEPISRSDSSQVAILHVGRGEGFFYYVMELADDASAVSNQLSVISNQSSEPRAKSLITDHCLLITSYIPKTLKRLMHDRGALPPAECITVALSLARALSHLHGHGLVHRNVKPSNVIFVGGVAKLADIGLVTSVDATRSFVGTEGYLPPEGAGTPQADLYSLGKVLYEMSTGCDRKEFPALPPDIATRPDREALAELNAIVVRAGQIDPRERYASADEMLAELKLLQRGRSVKRKRALGQRRKLAKKALSGALILASIAAVVILLQRGRPSDFSVRARPRRTKPRTIFALRACILFAATNTRPLAKLTQIFTKPSN